MQHRLSPVLLALAVVAAGMAWIISLRVPPVSAVAPLPSSRAERVVASAEPVIAPHKKASPPAVADPFWPPPAPPKSIVAQLPMAPPPPRPTLPYKFFGRMTNPDGRQAIFVSRENEQYEVKPDAVLEGQFKVVSMNDAQIVFEHIASGEKLEMVLPPVPKNNSGSGL